MKGSRRLKVFKIVNFCRFNIISKGDNCRRCCHCCGHRKHNWSQVVGPYHCRSISATWPLHWQKLCKNWLALVGVSKTTASTVNRGKEVRRQIAPNMTAELHSISTKHNAFVIVLGAVPPNQWSIRCCYCSWFTALCLRALLPKCWLALLNIAVASMLTGSVDRRYHNGKSLTLCRKLKLTSDYARVRHAPSPAHTHTHQQQSQCSVECARR